MLREEAAQWRDTVTLAVVCLLLLAVPAWAQIDRGQIAGFVKDQQGAVVPRRHRHPGRQLDPGRAHAHHRRQGYYIGVSLLPGVYEVSVELQGFKKFQDRGQGGRRGQGRARRRPRDGRDLRGGHGRGRLDAAPDGHRPGRPPHRGQADPGPDAQRPQPDPPAHAQAGVRSNSAFNTFSPTASATAAGSSTAAAPTRTS